MSNERTILSSTETKTIDELLARHLPKADRVPGRTMGSPHTIYLGAHKVMDVTPQTGLDAVHEQIKAYSEYVS